jgi:hypothetical protein
MESWQGWHTPHPSWLARDGGPTQPPAKWVPVLFLGGKCGRCMTMTTYLHLAPRLMNEKSNTSNPLLSIHGLFWGKFALKFALQKCRKFIVRLILSFIHYFVTYWCNLIAKLYAGPSLSDMGTFPVDPINILMKPVRPTSLFPNPPIMIHNLCLYNTRRGTY